MIASMTKVLSILMIIMSTTEGYKAVQTKDAAHDEGALSLGGTDHKVAYAVDADGALTAMDSIEAEAGEAGKAGGAAEEAEEAEEVHDHNLDGSVAIGADASESVDVMDSSAVEGKVTQRGHGENKSLSEVDSTAVQEEEEGVEEATEAESDAEVEAGEEEEHLGTQIPATHTKCRSPNKYTGGIARHTVRNKNVKWSVLLPKYTPVQYEAPVLAKFAHMTKESTSCGGPPCWADPPAQPGKTLATVIEEAYAEPGWKKFEEGLRQSHMGPYMHGAPGTVGGVPRNPVGRTGMKGRGLLGKWGPNHAADPIVTICDTGKVKFLMIERQDTSDWALPGGMVDFGEKVSVAALRELKEETGLDLKAWATANEPVPIYTGYVDDPRNTDNAWMETAAFHFHLPEVKEVKAGDDATRAGWVAYENKKIDLSQFATRKSSKIYASHQDMMDLTLKSMKKRKVSCR